MENPSSAELDMIEELLARMQNSGQPYDDVDDDDDDDDYDESDDDDDDAADGLYSEQGIQTLLNPYGGGGESGDGGGSVDELDGVGNAQTMNFLQGLLNMGNSSIPGMAEIEAAIGGSMGGLGNMGNPMEGSAGSFLPSMQNLIPNMGSEVAGVLGAFAGGMGSMMEYGSGGSGGCQIEDYDEDDDDDDDDDDALSDEEDDDEDEEEDDEDDDDDVEEVKHSRMDRSDLALGGLMAASLLNGGSHHQRYPQDSVYPSQGHHAALMPPPSQRMAQRMSQPQRMPLQQYRNPAASSPSLAAPLGFILPAAAVAVAGAAVAATVTSKVPVPLPVSQPAPLSHAQQVSQQVSLVPHHQKVITTSIMPSLGSTSGGTVIKTDPLAALTNGVAGMSFGAGISIPMVKNILGKCGGTTVINKNTVSNIDVIQSNPRSLPEHGTSSQINPLNSSINAQLTESQLGAKLEKDKAHKKEECEDDKASLGSVTGSETSGMGKSDTESVGKKTPSPTPGSANGQEVGSCASIPDLASATESMRDSDTDNHSEVHNVTANLSDLDNDVHDHKSVPPQQYAVGPLPVVVEHPTYGWGSMVGLDTAKEALKKLFSAASFPEVFEGTEGTCKGILLFGPSGSGKTCLARALAKESNNALFVGINSKYLLTHPPFEAVQLVRCMFEQARRQKPAVLLFDEIEALSYNPNNESGMSAKNEILAQTRGLTTLHPQYLPRKDSLTDNDSILLLGTTNQPWLLEDTIRRVFTYNIHVKLPAEKPRHELYRMFLQNLHHNITDEQFNCLISKSEGYSAADINNVIRQASHRVPLEGSSPRHLTFDNIATVMTQYRCRFSPELKQKYIAYITASTHRAGEVEDNAKNKKDKKKGVKKFSHVAKSLAVAVLSVIE